MNRLFLRLRTLLHGSDAERAARGETELLARESHERQSFVRRMRDTYCSSDSDAVVLGTTSEGLHVRTPAKQLAGHMGLWGPSGAGKSYLLVGILTALLRSGVRRLVVADPKEETIALMKRAIVDVARSLPSREADELLSRVVVLDLFSSAALPRLQVLAARAGLDPELHAYEIANLITAEMDMAAGFRQEAILHRVLECLIRARLPLTVLPQALLDPSLLRRLADFSETPELFRSTAERLGKESKERLLGLVSRAERLLRLRSTRLALGGTETCIDFGSLLDEHITLVNLAPPQGSGDIGKFLSGLIWLELTHAIRRRPNGSPPVHVAIDEWPTFLAAGGNRLAGSFEDLLRLARSKGVFLTLLSQDMTSVAKVSSTLPDVVRTNLHLHAVFRAADANAWDFILPVSGTRRKERPTSWESQRPAYLERAGELAVLREELSRLPDRECYFVDRRTGLPGIRMRTADLDLRARNEDVHALDERASRSDAIAAIGELERGEQTVRDRVRHLLGNEPTPNEDPQPLLRIGRRRELG